MIDGRQQTSAILDTETGVLEERVLENAGNTVRDFYLSFEKLVRVGIEATGWMQWFLQLMEELDIECQVGHPAKIRSCEPRNQKLIAATRSCCFDCSAKTAFPLSGCCRAGTARRASAAHLSTPVGADTSAGAERADGSSLRPHLHRFAIPKTNIQQLAIAYIFLIPLILQQLSLWNTERVFQLP